MKILALLGVTCVCFGVAHSSGFNPRPAQGPVGRYQMEAVGNTLYVLDTSSGQCWRRSGRDWVDEGNPTIRIRRAGDRPVREGRNQARVNLPEKSVSLTVRQRQYKALPGSEGTVLVQIRDITGGQVLVSVRTRDRRTLLDEASLKEGQVAKFKFDGRPYVLRIRDLTNLLVGEDFAVLDIAERSEDLPPIEPDPRDAAESDAADEESNKVRGR